MVTKLGQNRKEAVPSGLVEWLEKWEPKITTLKKSKRYSGSTQAIDALDELEFLLTRTMDRSVSE